MKFELVTKEGRKEGTNERRPLAYTSRGRVGIGPRAKVKVRVRVRVKFRVRVRVRVRV